jgi:hypothetical protein
MTSVITDITTDMASAKPQRPAVGAAILKAGRCVELLQAPHLAVLVG